MKKEKGTPQENVKNLLEIKEYKYKGATVLVKIDHKMQKVSFVKYRESSHINYPDKKWLFAGRGLEYMNGWLNILEAMKYAITEAKKLLEKDLAENSVLRIEDTPRFCENKECRVWSCLFQNKK